MKEGSIIKICSSVICKIILEIKLLLSYERIA